MDGGMNPPFILKNGRYEHDGPGRVEQHENGTTLRKGTMIFSIEDRVGALDDVLKHLKELNINMTRIESRPSKTESWDYDFFVDYWVKEDVEESSRVESVMEMRLKKEGNQVQFITSTEPSSPELGAPWFPRKISDLDEFSHKTMEYGEELSSDHPGFTDQAYRLRRMEITNVSKAYKHGMKIPTIDYLPQEIETWGKVFRELTRLFPTHACREHQYVFPLLIQNCGYREDNIPQLEDISNFLKGKDGNHCTGFTLRPVVGLLTPRDFLNGLAFRVFHSTQYIRHHSKPLYTPEPDICHELLGHVPLFADPDFAEFSQEIGLASLGANDDDIEKLSTIYWFTVEFGLCRQGKDIRAYGAGLLSSFGELEYCLTDEPEKRAFDPEQTARTPYPITKYQPIYFVADSFHDAKEKVRNYTQNLHRPFIVRYDPFTQSIQVLDKKEKIISFMSSIRANVELAISALRKFD